MRHHCLILLSTLGWLACSGSGPRAGAQGGGGGPGGGGLGGGNAGSSGGVTGTGVSGSDGGVPAGGAAGSTITTGLAGMPGTGGTAATGGTSGASGQAGPSLDVLAGDIGGAGTADGTGAAARFTSPVGVVTDGTGHLYVADVFGVRRIDTATGAVTTIAGRQLADATQQNHPTDGVGAAATFGDVKAIAIDGGGNVYVADGHRIRKVVVATGTVTTLADAMGTPANIRGPVALASDGANTLYVADTYQSGTATTGYTTHSSLRKVDTTTATVTTLADQTGVSVQFDNLQAVASDRAGTIYVADGNLIKSVDAATGNVVTVAGSSLAVPGVDGVGSGASFYQPAGLAADGTNALYVVDGGAIRRIDIASSSVVTIAGGTTATGSQDGAGTDASFYSPGGIVADGAGNLYVADVDNDAIRKVVIATGAVTTVAGLPAHPGAADASGPAAGFYTPADLTGDGAGNVYVTDRGNATIRRIAIATGDVTTIAGTPGMYASTDGTGAAGLFSSPAGIATDGAGNLYVADGSIRKVAVATRAVTTLVATDDPATPASGYSQPWGIVSDHADNLYFTDTHNNTVRRVVISTQTVTTIAGTAGQAGSADGTGAAARFNGPADLAIDGAGNLYVADSGNQTIRRIVIATGAVTTVAGTAGQAGATDGIGAAARFNDPVGVDIDGAGALYVADFGNHTVRKVALDSGAVSTVLGIPGRAGVTLGALPGSLNGPYDVLVLPTGELAVVDILENAVLITRP
jgi:hypothetical protein